jgi:eukaryotic-like serine/threonine-protein kinase
MKTPERWARVDAILQDALDLPEVERSSLLARECGGDDSLRHEVLELLEADGRAGAFLGGPTGPAGVPAVRPVGEQIGSYRLEGLLGRGGMSTVYLAARADGAFDRQVALKVLEPGLFSAEVRQRFDIERRILARLEHPLIARLLDGGTTADGSPYLVMERIEGRPIDRYCREESLSVRERVALLKKVCQAVTWAHRNLIVHRDLKPGNVLITAEGEPRLLDFGIAKLLEPSAFDVAADQTRSQLRLMSPAYASPEQIAGGAITTATDVWALGTLAYEVLTGVRPFGTPATLEELFASRRIEPELPSRRAEAEDAGQRDAVRRQLRGDLDTIVLKALRLEPERRYGTARELGADLERYLGGQAIAARADALLYRAGKLVRRHRLLAATVAASLLVIFSLVVGLALQARRLRLERDTAREVMELFVGTFGEDGGTRGEGITARQVLEKSEPEIRRRLAGQPELLGRLLIAIGRVYRDLGRLAEGRSRLEEARRLLSEAGPPRELHSALLDLGVLEHTAGDYRRAETLYREALDLARRELGENDPAAANDLAHLGRLAFARHRPQDALEPLLAAIPILERDPGRPYGEIAFTHASLGGAYRKLGRFDEAEASLRRALAVATENEVLPYLFVLYSDHALLESDRGNFGAAVEEFGRSIAGLERAMGARHGFTAKVRVNLCQTLRRRGDLSEAERVCRQGLADLLVAAGPGHEETRSAQDELALVLRDQSKKR